jgi:N-acyl amino acid synthase of PEP-CTERM/exosortase system
MEDQPLAEISRLAVSKRYRRRAGDGRYGLALPPDGVKLDRSTPVERRSTFPTVIRLYRMMYHAVKRRGIVQLIATMESTLHRSLRILRFPFYELGPEVDYYGPVRPYYLNVDELDRRLVWACPDLLRYFNAGLEPHFQSPALSLIPR